MRCNKNILLLVLLSICSAWVSAANIENVRVWRAPDNTRLVFDLSSATEHKLLNMPGEQGNAQRIVVILPKAQFSVDEKKINLKNTPVSALHAEKMGDGIQLVLDLSAKVKPKSFLLPANNQYGDRLVLDLFDETAVSEVKTVKPAANGMRDIVIAVDAGHGGEDPGARSAKGIFEKDVTLAIARELANKINSTPGYSACVGAHKLRATKALICLWQFMPMLSKILARKVLVYLLCPSVVPHQRPHAGWHKQKTMLTWWAA